jgi:hypothetical protein
MNPSWNSKKPFLASEAPETPTLLGFEEIELNYAMTFKPQADFGCAVDQPLETAKDRC